MAKKITGYIKLQVPAGAANPSPPIGPALGQRGVNIMEFCKAFNAKTKDMEQGTPIPVKITVFSDRSFSFERAILPAETLPGSFEPDLRLAAFLIRNDAGGVFVTNENDRSA